MTSFVRGSSITFKASCTDAAGAPFTPTAATLRIVYVRADGTARVRTVDVAPMAIVGNVISAIWDSSVASDSIPITWHIRASNALDAVAKDGSFVLSASEANPAL